MRDIFANAWLLMYSLTWGTRISAIIARAVKGLWMWAMYNLNPSLTHHHSLLCSAAKARFGATHAWLMHKRWRWNTWFTQIDTNHFKESMSTLTVWGVVYFCAMEIMFEKNNVQYDHIFYYRATGNIKLFNSEWTLAWHRTSETGSRIVATTNWTTEAKCQNAFIRTHFATCSKIHKLPGVW